MTREEGRRFGLTLAGAFVALAALAWWRGHAVPATGAIVAGTALALAGLVVPTRLGGVERAWMGLAHAISKVTTPLVMGAMFIGMFLPVGVIRRLLGGNPLVHSEQGHSFWRVRADDRRRSDMRRQF